MNISLSTAAYQVYTGCGNATSLIRAWFLLKWGEEQRSSSLCNAESKSDELDMLQAIVDRDNSLLLIETVTAIPTSSACSFGLTF
jgi:hypothetical protein